MSCLYMVDYNTSVECLVTYKTHIEEVSMPGVEYWWYIYQMLSLQASLTFEIKKDRQKYLDIMLEVSPWWQAVLYIIILELSRVIPLCIQHQVLDQYINIQYDTQCMNSIIHGPQCHENH